MANNLCGISFECYAAFEELTTCPFYAPEIGGADCTYRDTFVSMREPAGCENPAAKRAAMLQHLQELSAEEQE